MIHYVVGDLLESDCNVIAHGCNCFGSMGAGIAKKIAKKYPAAYRADIDFLVKNSHDNRKLLGRCSSALISDRLLVYNLYTQYTYGMNKMQVDYDAVRSSFHRMWDELIFFDISDNGISFEQLKVGIPKIGCGLAGGDWNVVSKIVEESFREKDIYVYTLDGGEVKESIASGRRIEEFIDRTKKEKI